MKAIRTVKLKITTSNTKLYEVGIAYRNAANWLSAIVHDRKIVETSASLSNEFYATVREKFNLPSQVCCSLFRHVLSAYRSMRSNGKWELAVFKKIVAPVCWKRDFNVTSNGMTIWGTNTEYKSRPLPEGRWADSKLKLVGSRG